jgi:radial spoke head protein 9
VPKRKIRRRRFTVTEEVRLAAVVARINTACSVVPRGAFAIDQADAVRRNPGFEGLSGRDALNLSFYQHLRAPEVVPKKTLHERHAANLVFDFLDRLDEDDPRGQWALRPARNGARVEVRSLLWPGYTAWHVPETQKFGAVYNGTGQEAADMGLMI